MGVSMEIRFRCDSVKDPSLPEPPAPASALECDRETWTNYDSSGTVRDAVEAARQMGWAISRVPDGKGGSRWRVRCPRHLGRNGRDNMFIAALGLGG